ncbi:MAG: hypothetical protein L7T26_03265 [Pseudomonadales bacterium]|nr:hypothetical protein [Pseudomonadales bacterium]
MAGSSTLKEGKIAYLLRWFDNIHRPAAFPEAAAGSPGRLKSLLLGKSGLESASAIVGNLGYYNVKGVTA